MEELSNGVGSCNNTPIKDRYHFVYGSAFFIGMVILFPWNILITVTTYWNYKFRNVSLDNETVEEQTNDDEALTDLQYLYNTYLAIAANVPNATFVILHALFGHHFSIKLRLYGSQVTLLFNIKYMIYIRNLNLSKYYLQIKGHQQPIFFRWE